MKTKKLAAMPPPTRLMQIAAIALASVWLVLGVIEQIIPQNFTSMYGLEITGAAGHTYVRGIGARNIVLAWTVIFTAIAGFRAPLIAMSAGLSVMSALEFFIAFFAVGFSGAIRFLVFTLVLAALTLWIALSKKK